VTLQASRQNDSNEQKKLRPKLEIGGERLFHYPFWESVLKELETRELRFPLPDLETTVTFLKRHRCF